MLDRFLLLKDAYLIPPFFLKKFLVSDVLQTACRAPCFRHSTDQSVSDGSVNKNSVLRNNWLQFLTGIGSACHAFLVWWRMPLSDKYIMKILCRRGKFKDTRKKSFGIIHPVSVSVGTDIVFRISVPESTAISTQIPKYRISFGIPSSVRTPFVIIFTFKIFWRPMLSFDNKGGRSLQFLHINFDQISVKNSRDRGMRPCVFKTLY